MYLEGFETRAGELGWNVNVIDTAGDVAAVISRIEDAVTQKVDAIIINVDPAQITAGLQVASEAGIPVIGMDSGTDPLLYTNVTSNGYAMAAETAVYVANQIEGKGNVVMFVFDAFPPVQIRGVIADAVFGNYPDITVMDRITPDVQDGGIADSRAKMEAVLAANPDPGSVAAVWAAWDQPALGALQAIEDAGRADEGIVIVGMDANPQAPRRHRGRRELRSLHGAGFRRHRLCGCRCGRAGDSRRRKPARCDLRSDEAHHKRQRQGLIAASTNSTRCPPFCSSKT